MMRLRIILMYDGTMPTRIGTLLMHTGAAPIEVNQRETATCGALCLVFEWLTATGHE